MKKQLTYKNLVRLSEKEAAELKELPDRLEIGKRLNEEAMKAAGYKASEYGADKTGNE